MRLDHGLDVDRRAGFAIDEPVESLGEKLSLPPFIEHLREEIEPNLRPIVNPRQVAA